MSIAILPAEAPSCMVLDELAVLSRADEPGVTDDDVLLAAAAAHTDNEAVAPSTDALAQHSDSSVHVGMW